MSRTRIHLIAPMGTIAAAGAAAAYLVLGQPAQQTPSADRVLRGGRILTLDDLNTTSWDQIVQIVAQAVEKAKPGQWIVGRGWHQEKWTAPPQPSVEGFPTHQSLDAVSPNNPVVLGHASGHASFVNRRAMGLSTITRATPNPGGGETVEDRHRAHQ